MYVREHGFQIWEELAQRVTCPHQIRACRRPNPFLAAFRDLESGDVAALNALLRRKPRLAQKRGTNGNTLLNWL